MYRTDGSSFSDRDGGGGPADDIIPHGRVFCYSSDEDQEQSNTIPLHQRIKRSRFVSRIQEERIQIQSATANQKLDMEQFQPMMTSEKVDTIQYKTPAVPTRVTRVTRRGRNKRECSVEDYYDDTTRYQRKRERKESDYGSLSTLDSSMLKLDIIESDPKFEVSCIILIKIKLPIVMIIAAVKIPGQFHELEQVIIRMSDLQKNNDHTQKTNFNPCQGI